MVKCPNVQLGRKGSIHRQHSGFWQLGNHKCFLQTKNRTERLSCFWKVMPPLEECQVKFCLIGESMKTMEMKLTPRSGPEGVICE